MNENKKMKMSDEEGDFILDGDIIRLAKELLRMGWLKKQRTSNGRISLYAPYRHRRVSLFDVPRFYMFKRDHCEQMLYMARKSGSTKMLRFVEKYIYNSEESVSDCSFSHEIYKIRKFKSVEIN